MGVKKGARQEAKTKHKKSEQKYRFFLLEVNRDKSMIMKGLNSSLQGVIQNCCRTSINLVYLCCICVVNTLLNISFCGESVKTFAES